MLNRVVTPGNISEIYGALNSNGQVFLINPAGIVIGPSGVINAAGFTASALDLPDADFMRGNALEFRANGQVGAIINRGTIHTGAGGVALVGGHVANYGTITLAVGDNVKLSAEGSYVAADAATIVNGISEYSPIIKNEGIIRANRRR